MKIENYSVDKKRRKGAIVLSLLFTPFHSFSLPLIIFFLFSIFNSANAQIELKPGAATNRQGIDRMRQRNLNGDKQQKGMSRSDTTTHSDTSATKGLVFVEETPDSILRQKVFFFNYTPREVKINEVWNPVLDPTGVQFCDPLDGFNGTYYLGKGIVGHPHLSIYPSIPLGFSHGLQVDEMEGYAKTPENVHLYQTMTPYTMLSYNSSLKKDYQVHVTHTQNVKPGWNLSFDYHLQCPEGVLSGSAVKNHFLDATTNYFSPDSRLQLQAGFIWQSFTIDENGGLTNDSIFTENLMSNFSGLPVRYQNSGSRHLRHDVFGRVTYNLVRQVEQVRERDSLTVRYDTVGADSITMVIDTLVVTDTLRIGTPRTLNAGVWGLEARYHRQKRASYIMTVADSSLWNETCATLFWTNDAYPDYRWRNPMKITLGATLSSLQYSIESIADIPSATSISPFAKLDLQIGHGSLLLEGELDNSPMRLDPVITEPDYYASARLALPFDSLGNTSASLSAAMHRQMPEVRMLMTTGFTMEPILSQSYGLHLSHKNDSSLFRLIDLDIHATQMDHNVWYDSTLAVCVGDNSLWLAQAALTVRMAWGWFHIDMQQLFQHSTDKDQADVPLWASKNSLYGDFTLFRGALRLQLGTDVRYFTSFTPDGYDAATGLFYNQDCEVGDYVWADVFLNIQIKRAGIYLKAGHLNALWESHPRYFLLPHYPGQKFGLFWGITWNFFD